MNDNSPAYTTEYIADSAHYEKVIARVAGVKRQLWIGTADIKDLYVAQGRQTVPFLAIIAGLIKKGVEIRLIHAKEPGQAFREDFDRYPELATGLERILCPRVHFKLLIFDMKTAYIGSANLTGTSRPASSPTTPRSWKPPPTSSTAYGWARTAVNADARPSAATASSKRENFILSHVLA